MRKNPKKLNKLGNLRKNLGLSKNKMAKQLNCSRSFILLWEKGERRPSLKTCQKLIKLALDYNKVVTYEDLID